MNDKHNCKFKKVKDFNGSTLVLTLVKEKDYEGKRYSLYTVCKVVKDGDEEKTVPLYTETFTPEQVDGFYNNPSYYVAGIPE